MIITSIIKNYIFIILPPLITYANLFKNAQTK